jgi:hypothetical protein
VGRSASARTIQILAPDGPINLSAPQADWIVPTDEAHLFAPSCSGLAKLGMPPDPMGFQRAKQVWATTYDTVKATFGSLPCFP